MMIPLQHYEFGHIVLILTSVLILLSLVYETRNIYYNNKDHEFGHNLVTASVVGFASRELNARNATVTSKKEKKSVSFSGKDEFHF